MSILWYLSQNSCFLRSAIYVNLCAFHAYNAAHSRARNDIERQYGVWEKRFFYIDTPFRCSLETAQTVIVATAVLHNLALSLGDYEDPLPLQQDDTLVKHSQEHGGITKRNAIVANFFN
ncbi:nuclease HARBI1 [Trichonephila clavata]|uniref:Nuclease HARBI1 n=1 Tax=Trichonephila clavata TaxID=2740835 RepID=A0A8X6GJN9_TRICU|nr:nuclease HARBI1 [Trichonephila clavata]